MVVRHKLFLILGCLLLVVTLTAAQFGVKKKHIPGAGISDVDIPALTEMLDDPDMAQALELLTHMSPEEMKETLSELMGMLGNDPETQIALEEALQEVAKMDTEQIQESLLEMAEEEEIALAIGETMQQLANADESMLDTILERKDVILESVIQSGKLTKEDVDFFRSNPDMWEAELKNIWRELRKEATT